MNIETMLNNQKRVTNSITVFTTARMAAVLCACFLVFPISKIDFSSRAMGQEAGETSTKELSRTRLGGITQRGLGSARTSPSSDLDLFPNITSLDSAEADPSAEPVTWKAQYYANADGTGLLEVEASLSSHWHIYSTTQPNGGPTRTQIKISDPDEVKLGGEFEPDREPSKSVSSTYDGLTVEEHEGTVTWSAPITVPAGFASQIEISVHGLVCVADDENGRCMPVREDVTAAYVGPLASNPNHSSVVAFQQAAATGAEPAAKEKLKPFRDDKYVVQWTAEVVPANLAPGQTGLIRFTAKPDEGFHVYRVATDDAESATNFVVTKKDGLLIGTPVANKKAIAHSILPDLPPVHYYTGAVTFQLPIKVPADLGSGSKTIDGMIAYQACTDNSCHKPTALKFTAKVGVGQANAAATPIVFASAKSAEALDAAAETKWVDPIKDGAGKSDGASTTDDNEAGVAAADGPPTAPTDGTDSSFFTMLGFAFLGGLILNVMPCVLPVVGLKIMGFVSQAGEDRKRIMMLNLVYVFGIMSVFAILAVVAAVSKFGWGEQFTYFEVKLGLTILMFALALSYLGVWEIPAPGMAGGKTSADLQNREGLAGAFSKGVFATILSTPCSGPLLGYILGATLNYTPLQTVTIMLTVGFGMSSPYLLIGAQPKLISWLPKPGPWMETLKQSMAFLFLGTVAYFFAQFSDEHKVPVFVTLIAVWFGCWIIGQVPNWADMRKRLAAWTTGIAAASLISIGAFHYLKPNDQLAWLDYSEPSLVSLQNQGKTVLLDFSAKWCATCQVNYAVAINTEETRQVLDELDAVAMYADWTDQSDEIKSKLEELNSRSIPLLAIYPGGRPGQPIILRDVVSQQDVINALREAGASVDASSTAKRSPVSVAVSR
jgi:suppressor for copper-sensitivity B